MTFTENSLELSIIELLQKGGYTHIHGSDIHKERSEVLLYDDLRNYLKSRYRDDGITSSEIDSIIRRLELYPASSLYSSNRDFMRDLSDGFIIKREDKTKKDLYIELIDYRDTEANTFKIINQLEIVGYERRIPDGIIYINGLPLVVFEFKSATRESATLHDAYTQLTTRYCRDIPELLKYNAFLVISDGVNTKMGGVFSKYDYFYSWKKTSLDSDTSEGIDSLYTMIEGALDRERLLQITKDFIYFPDSHKNDTKIVCRYPQFYATIKLYNNILNHQRPLGDGKGGTYFGATGSGKSYIMLYLARMLMRSRDLSSPTIVIITDRVDLDSQLGAQFQDAKGFIGDDMVKNVSTRLELKEYLEGRKSGGVFLTTIHKFSEDLDVLSERSNIICISDEAHRTQVNLDKKVTIDSDEGVIESYGFAKYLHDSLPNATYVGFTGTPIDKTFEVFGDVVDSYTMKQSVSDEITVRLVYEGRASKVILDSMKLKDIENYYNGLLESGASEYQVETSKKQTTNMMSILSDPSIIENIAIDFVKYYDQRLGEGATIAGKAMFVAPNRPIAYQIYKEILKLKPEWGDKKLTTNNEELTIKEQKEFKAIEYIKLIMTRSKDDPTDLYEAIGPSEDIKIYDRAFKNIKSNFKIAIVVDMWLTGFDVPFLDTIYIYKPLKTHNLIQTISRVNRVYEGKNSGLVVDYIGIKNNLNTALKMYSEIDSDDFVDISVAVKMVRDMVDLLSKLFYKFDNNKYFTGSPLEKLDTLNKAVEFVQQTKELEYRFMSITKKLKQSFDLVASTEDIDDSMRSQIHFYFGVRAILYKLSRGDTPDVFQMNQKVSKMIQDAILSDGIEEIFGASEDTTDIFDPKYLDKIEKINLPNTKIKLLEQLLKQAIGKYKKVNKIKGVDFSKRLQSIIDKYNTRQEDLVLAMEVLDDVASELSNLFKDLKFDMSSFEDMGIDFEEKAFYDILKNTRDKYKFEYSEDKLIKLARAIKEIVDDKSKYTDWAQKEDIKAELKVAIIITLDKHKYPPVTYDNIYKDILEQAENFKKYGG